MNKKTLTEKEMYAVCVALWHSINHKVFSEAERKNMKSAYNKLSKMYKVSIMEVEE